MSQLFPEYRDEVRNKIISTAYRIFRDRGYHATRMEDIAQELKVTKPALYQYFNGKEELFNAVCEFGRDELHGIFDRALNQNSLEEGCSIIFDTLLQDFSFSPKLGVELYAIAARNDAIRAIIRESRLNDLAIVEEFFKQLQKKHIIRKDLDPHHIARGADALMSGIQIDIVLGMTLEKAKSVWMSSILAMVRSH